MHNNSRKSYEECKADDNFKRIIHRIAYYFEQRSAHSFTDREVKDLMYGAGQLPFNDMNMVRPKITKLIKDGMLEEVRNVEDPATKRSVRKVQWRFTNRLF